LACGLGARGCANPQNPRINYRGGLGSLGYTGPGWANRGGRCSGPRIPRLGRREGNRDRAGGGWGFPWDNEQRPGRGGLNKHLGRLIGKEGHLGAKKKNGAFGRGTIEVPTYGGGKWGGEQIRGWEKKGGDRTGDSGKQASIEQAKICGGGGGPYPQKDKAGVRIPVLVGQSDSCWRYLGRGFTFLSTSETSQYTRWTIWGGGGDWGTTGDRAATCSPNGGTFWISDPPNPKGCWNWNLGVAACGPSVGREVSPPGRVG